MQKIKSALRSRVFASPPPSSSQPSSSSSPSPSWSSWSKQASRCTHSFQPWNLVFSQLWAPEQSHLRWKTTKIGKQMSALATILEINWSSTCQIRCCAMWLCHFDVCNISACVCVWLCFVFCLCVCVSVCLCLYEHLFVEHMKVLLCLCNVQTSLVNTMAKLERVKFNPLTHYHHHHCHCQVQPSDREATWDTIFIIMNNYTILIINVKFNPLPSRLISKATWDALVVLIIIINNYTLIIIINIDNYKIIIIIANAM